MSQGGVGQGSEVSIRAPVRGAAPRSQCRCRASARVSIRAPVRGATVDGRVGLRQAARVSIRAPVRGATGVDWWRFPWRTVFQSAPPCGGRQARHCSAHELRHRFNPRPRAGGDLLSTEQSCRSLVVSIRAPVRGATGAVFVGFHVGDPFQSAPPCGGRLPQSASSSQAAALFQSAPPCGGRLATGNVPTFRVTRFNPRPRAGGDTTNRTTTPTSCWCFNPRPRAGGDPPPLRARRVLVAVSIRAPVRGATCSDGGPPPRNETSFNPRPRAGGDRRTADCPSMRSRSFNPRPRAGGDHRCSLPHQTGRRCFNPRPRAGGDRRSTQVSGLRLI